MYKHAGYTLIELLVVITLMVLLLGGGMATYFRFEERQSTEVAARELHKAFITARAKARFRERAECPTESVIGFRTSIRNDGGVFKVDILSICGTDRNDYFNDDADDVQSPDSSTLVYTIPENISLESPDPATLSFEVDFFTLYGGAWINGDPEPVPVPITVSRGVARYSFNIDGGGDISPVVKLN